MNDDLIEPGVEDLARQHQCQHQPSPWKRNDRQVCEVCGADLGPFPGVTQEQRKVAVAALHLWSVGDLDSLLETAGGDLGGEQWIRDNYARIVLVEDDLVERVARSITATEMGVR